MPRASSFPDRARLWSQLASGSGEKWDVVIVGGGITGAGILREAVRSGYRSLLVEQGDFAWGTSGRSSKMVHGGLRYLASGNVSLTRHALLERERLLREAPGLVQRLPYYFPLYKGRFPPGIAAAALFWLYDRLAGVDDHRRVTNEDLEQLFPALSTSELKGAYRYTDAVTDDARLTLRLLAESVRLGGCVRNYTRAAGLLRAGGRVEGVILRDDASGEEINVRCGVVLNATGAWAARLGGELPHGARIRPQRGSHLVLPPGRFPVAAALFLMHPDDGRRVFIYPWEGRTVVGTTDIPHSNDLNMAARITPLELDYLLRATRPLFGHDAPRAEDVISTWSGVRPIILTGRNTDPSKASREHQVWASEGLVSCSGGKLTTFHHMAEDVLRHARPFLAPPAIPAGDGRIFSQTGASAQFSVPGDPAASWRLFGRYGEDATALTAAARREELEALEDTGFSLAEARWALQHESVVHLDDLMLRRTRLGLLLANGAASVLEQIEPLFREELGWSTGQWASERARYSEIVRRNYSIPQAA